MRKKSGFTLTEILVSILIIGIVMSAVMTLFVSAFKSYEFHQDIMEAKQRGQIALAAIEPLVVNAGLGMPTTSDDFEEVFTGLEKLFPLSTEDEHFTGPVQIANDGKRNIILETSGVYTDKYLGNELWLVYGVQSGYGVSQSKEILEDFSSGDIEIQPDDFSLLTGNIGNNKASLKGWIVFPVSEYPLSISDTDLIDKKLTVASAKNQDLYRYDELHYVRAAKIRVNSISRNLEVDFMMDSSEKFQPVAEGIDALRCIFEPFDADGEPSRLLTVTVLSRADTMRSELNITAVEGWDTANWGAIPDVRYRYAVVSRSWRIRN